MYNTKNKTQKVYRKNKPNLNLIPKNCVCVFPIEIVGGKTQVSNLGIMPNRRHYDKGSFLYWQEVFDGRSALKIQWEGSITLEKPENQNYYVARPHIGKYYYGKPISNANESLEISEDPSFEDFMSMKASQTITLRFEYDPNDRIGSKYETAEHFQFKLVDNDIYKLYQIPEICENKLMYIESHNEYFDDTTGLSKGCEITFTTLGDKIQKSGKAIEQYCSWSAPGEFAVIPKVVEYYTSETEWEKQVIIDPIPLFYPTPIKYLQVEQQGPALTSCIYALGRRQEYITEQVEDPETHETYEVSYWKIGPSKFLLPCEFVTTQPNPLNRSSTPSKNYYCFPDEQVTMVTNTEALKWMIEQATSPLENVKNNGMISIGSNWSESGSHIRTEHPSNPVSETEVRKDYFDKTWFPLSYNGAPLGPHDTSGCIYAGNTMSFDSSDTMVDIMCKNAFIYNSQPIIPLSYYDSKPLYLRNIPIIGAIANFLKFGDMKLSSRTTSRKNSSLCFFGDCSLMNMCANLNGSTEQGQGTFGTPFKTGSCVFPINFFGTNETKFQKLGVSSTNTTFCVALTDQISLNGTIWDTIYLGQNQYEDSTPESPHYIFPETQQSLLVDSSLKPITPATSNFIIDAVVVQSIFDGKIRLSAYGEEENDFIYPQWTATILSNANWENGNMRDWTNIFLLSNWEERYCVQEDEFTWPHIPSKKEEAGDYVLPVNITEAFVVTDKNQFWQDIEPAWPLSSPFIGNRWQAQMEKPIYDHTVSYTDIGIESVIDKDTFISHFGSVTISNISSSIQVGNQSLTYMGQDNEFELTQGHYEYYDNKKLCSVRMPELQWNLGVSNEEFWVCLGEEHNPQSAYCQQYEIVLTLGDSGVRIQIFNTSWVESHKQEVVTPRKFYSCRGRLFTESQKFVSSLRFNNIVFKKRT